MAAASLLACTVGIVAIVKIAGPALWRTSPEFGFRALYGYAAGIMANSFFYIVFALTGLFAVAYFLGSEAVGIYRFCLQIVLPLDMILLAFHAAMGPIYPILSRENRQAELEEAYGTAIRWMVMLQIPFGIAVAWNRERPSWRWPVPRSRRARERCSSCPSGTPCAPASERSPTCSC